MEFQLNEESVMNSKETMRILVTAPLGVGGVTNMMISIQKHMEREKLNFDYLSFHNQKEPREDEVLALGSRKLVAAADEISNRFLRTFFRLNRIRKVCKKNRVQVLHFNADNPVALIYILAARAGGVKYITMHSHNASYGNSGKILKIVGGILKPLIPLGCNYYVGCSDLAAKFLFPRSIINSRNYEVWKNGIDLEKYDYNPLVRDTMRTYLGLGGKFVIGHAGRFCAQKNHTFLLDIFREIYTRETNAVLLLFGVGELMESIKEKAIKLGIIDRVIFYGVSNEMEKMWQVMDVFLMPSLHEGLPVTGIEAQASGLPCVLADSITKEVNITGNCEFISLSTPPAVWAKQVLTYKEYIRTSGRKLLEEADYDVQKTADKVAAFYMKIGERFTN